MIREVRSRIMTFLILLRDSIIWKKRPAGKEQSRAFFVPKQEIVDNDYDLSINKYKKVEYVPVNYPPTHEIMAELRRLEKEIAEEMAELEKLLL